MLIKQLHFLLLLIASFLLIGALAQGQNDDYDYDADGRRLHKRRRRPQGPCGNRRDLDPSEGRFLAVNYYNINYDCSGGNYNRPQHHLQDYQPNRPQKPHRPHGGGGGDSRPPGLGLGPQIFQNVISGIGGAGGGGAGGYSPFNRPFGGNFQGLFDGSIVNSFASLFARPSNTNPSSFQQQQPQQQPITNPSTIVDDVRPVHEEHDPVNEVYVNKINRHQSVSVSSPYGYAFDHYGLNKINRQFNQALRPLYNLFR